MSTYDITNVVCKVRLNIADIDTTVIIGARSTWTILFTDAEIGIFITRAGSDLNLASAYALLAIASSRALIAKVKKLGDYSEDLSKMAAELRAQAKQFFDLSASAAAAGDFAEIANTDFAARDIMLNEALRG